MGCGASSEAQCPDETHDDVVRKQIQTMRKLYGYEKQMYLTHMTLYGGR